MKNCSQKSTPVAVGKFVKYITDREKTVLGKLIRNVRRKAMRISNKSVPPPLYSNQSKTVNSIFATKKCALGYGKKENVSKFSFIKNIYQSAVEHQSREIISRSPSITINNTEKVYLVAGNSSKVPYKFTITE